MKIFLLSILTATILLATISSRTSAQTNTSDHTNSVELGIVDWGRDLKQAYRDSKKTGKPVFLLFQEVPGCHGVQEFGQTVLSNPIVANVIETQFVPVFIYNNKGGKDAEILKKFNEPAWNYQVIRFLDHKGSDIIPRKDQVNTVRALSERMKKVLQIQRKKIPADFDLLLSNHSEDPISEIAFAQHCFWTGEQRLGGLDGVVSTEAGFIDGREVTKVWYNPQVIETSRLIKNARNLKVGDQTYQMSENQNYRPAPRSDQKKQISGTQFANQELTNYQAAKINAFARTEVERTKKYLSK